MREFAKIAFVLGMSSAMAGAGSADVQTAASGLLKEGVAAISARKFPEAHAKFKQARAAATQPAEQDEIAIWTSRALAAEGKVEESRASLRLALKRPSGALAAEMGRSWIQYQPIDAKESIKFLLDVVKGYGAKDPEPWLVLGKAYVVDQQFVSAIRIYDLLLKNVKKDEVRAFTGLADAYLLSQKYQEAQDTMDRASRTVPDHPDVLFYIGRVKERDARVKTRSAVAAHYYMSAAKLAGNSPRYAAAAMFAFLRAGDATGAVNVFNSQKALTPEDSYVLWFEGLNKELGFKVPDAIALYERAAASNPENVYAHYVLASVFLGIGNKALRLSGAGIEPPESFRVAPFRNTARGAQEVATLKFLDPSFPGLDALYATYNRTMEMQLEAENQTPEQKAAVQQLINYTTKMNRHR